MTLHFVMPEHVGPRRIDDFLRKVSGFSYTQIKWLKHPGRLFKNGEEVRCVDKAMPGDVIMLVFLDEEDTNTTPEAIPLDILYEDEAMLVVNKQAFLPMHPSSFQHVSGTLVNAVAYHYRQSGISPLVRPVTRLDRNTTGATLIAKIAHVQHVLQTQAKKGQFQKTYIGFAEGVFTPPFGELDAAISRKVGSIVERVAAEEGLPSLTRYQTLEIGVLNEKTISVVSFQPITGRTHQIRVHAASAGHPLIGDDLYGGHHWYEMNRQALHCAKLNLLHPITGEPLEIKAPLPADMMSFRERLQIRNL